MPDDAPDDAPGSSGASSPRVRASWMSTLYRWVARGILERRDFGPRVGVRVRVVPPPRRTVVAR